MQQIAEGFLQIAVANMANAIKQISVQRGHDVTGTRWCASAARVDSMPAGSPKRWGCAAFCCIRSRECSSAYGMGLADVRIVREARRRTGPAGGADATTARARPELEHAALTAIEEQALGVESPELQTRVRLRYAGADAQLAVTLPSDRRAQIEDDDGALERWLRSAFELCASAALRGGASGSRRDRRGARARGSGAPAASHPSPLLGARQDEPLMALARHPAL